MSHEKITTNEALLPDKYQRFVNLSTEYNLLRSLNVKGSGNDNEVVYGDFVGIYFTNLSNERKVEVIAKTHEIMEVFDMVLKLELPEEVRVAEPLAFSGKKNSIARLSDSELDTPHAILAFGTNKYTGEEVVTMFTVIDVSPKEAFKEMQGFVRESKKFIN